MPEQSIADLRLEVAQLKETIAEGIEREDRARGILSWRVRQLQDAMQAGFNICQQNVRYSGYEVSVDYREALAALERAIAAVK